MLLRNKVSICRPSFPHLTKAYCMPTEYEETVLRTGSPEKKCYSFLISNSSWSSGNNIHILITRPYRKCNDRNTSEPEGKWYQFRGKASQESFLEEGMDDLKGKYKCTGEEVRGGREVKGFRVEHKGK